MKMLPLGAGLKTVDTSSCRTLADNDSPRLRGRRAVSRRKRIAELARYACRVCRRIVLLDEGKVDHIIPLSEGGPDDDGNLQYLCPECHDAKTAAEARARAGG